MTDCIIEEKAGAVDVFIDSEFYGSLYLNKNISDIGLIFSTDNYKIREGLHIVKIVNRIEPCMILAIDRIEIETEKTGMH